MIGIIKNWTIKVFSASDSKIYSFVFFVIFNLVLHNAHGSLDKNHLPTLRQQFITVEKELHKGNNIPFNKTRSSLRNYPLYPHLEGLFLRNKIFKINQSHINFYIRNHGKSLPSYQLQSTWLNFLIKHKHWKKYITAYNNSSFRSARYKCYQGWAHYKQNNLSLAWEKSKHLWLTGDSQHSACTPLFKAWKGAGELTKDLITERFWMTILENNISLARYLNKQISGKNTVKNIQRFWQVRKNPWKLTNPIIIKDLGEKLDITTINVVKNAISYNIKAGTNLWIQLRKTLPLSIKSKDLLDSWLALRLAKQINTDHTKTILQLDNKYRFHKVTEWRIRRALSQQNWLLVSSLINQLPTKALQKNQWRYWQAIAMGAHNSNLQQNMPIINTQKSQQSNLILNKLSEERGYYGFMAALLKDNNVNLNNAYKPMNKTLAQQLMTQYPHLSRIREWIALNRFYEAQLELNRLRPQLSKEDRPTVAYLAQEWNWHFQAITTAAKESLWDHLNLRFPKPLEKYFNRSAKKNDLDPAWPLAIARQESAFNPKARSKKGALGFMQLMPKTAKYTAQANNIKLDHLKKLHNPDLNIFLGTAYLAELQKKFKNNKVHATAAYNAGPTRVTRWLKNWGDLPLDIWIEIIPFDETRKYVKNVLAYRVIYNHLEDNIGTILSPEEARLLTLAQARFNSPRTALSSMPE